MYNPFSFLTGIALSSFLAVTAVQAEVKVGIAGALSGVSLPTGDQQEVGAEKAIMDLNGSGGVLGQEVSVISLDDACEPEQAEAVARQLVSEGVHLVVGHVCSGSSIAARPIYEEAGVIMISCCSTSPKLTDEGGPGIFRVIGRDDQQGAIAGDYLADNHATGNIAIIHDGQAYGQGLAELTKRQLNDHGVEEVLFERYAPDQMDYSSIVKQLSDARVDTLYAGGYQQDIALIIREAKKELPNLTLVSGDSLVSEDFVAIAGDAVSGTYFTFGPDIRLRPEAARVVAAFREENDYEPDGYTLYAYAAVQAWAQAVEQAGSLKSAAVVEALRSGAFDTVLGRIGFDDNGDITGASPFVWYVFTGDTFELAE